MSVQSAIKRKTAPDIRARKNGEPIVMLTSYHAHTAAWSTAIATSSWSAIPSATSCTGSRPRCR